MNKILVVVVGVLLAGGAVSALAANGDREQLAQCKTLVQAHFGDEARTKLRSIRNRADGTHMRLSVRPGDGSRQAVVCTLDDSGLSLNTRDGVALVPASSAAEKVSSIR